MTEKEKVLLCGDVEGKFKLLFNKVEAINKKNGPFDYLLCVGNFFGENNNELNLYKGEGGSKTIPIPTFIIGPNRAEDLKNYPDVNGCEIYTNLTYLGRHGLYTSSSGLKIAYLSGTQRKDKHDSREITFGEKDVTAVRNSCLKGCPGFRGVDILLSSQWPEGVTNNTLKKGELEFNGSRLVAWLATQVKPRYHVCGLENIHYERHPYRNQNESADGIDIATRFIALAKVANPEKNKWLYALNLTPIDKTRMSELILKTTDETLSPYPASMLSSTPGKRMQEQTQYFYDTESHEEGKKKAKRPKMEFDRNKCWFCLESQEASRHLVLSVGKEIYVALARGGVVDDHLLITPVMHHQSLSILPDDVKAELRLYKESIKNYYATTDRVPVYFERNFKTSHCQLQAVPVHKNQAAALKDAFQEIASVYHIKLRELDVELHEAAPAGTLYFYVELPDGVRLFYRIKKDFPLQFGREVVCCDRILDAPERFDWKDCRLGEAEEFVLAEKVKAEFRKFEVKL